MKPNDWQDTLSMAASAIEDLLETADEHAGCWADVPARLRALTAPPAPAVPPCFSDAIDDMENVMAWILRLPVPTDGATAKAGRLKSSIEACRAAMLAAAPEGGNG